MLTEPSGRRLFLRPLFTLALAVPAIVTQTISLPAAESIVLDEESWDQTVPEGKEVDCIYGDIVLRNDKIVAVIARPVQGRNANMTTKDSGGSLIDFTQIADPNDQLTSFQPGAGALAWRAVGDGPIDESKLEANGPEVTLRFRSVTVPDQATAELEYRLRDGDSFLTIDTIYHNPHQKPVTITPQDTMRADRSFTFQIVKDSHRFVAYDEWWCQAYGIDSSGVTAVGDSLEKLRPVLGYRNSNGDDTITLQPNAKGILTRRVYAARNELELQGLMDEAASKPGEWIELTVQDRQGPISLARVELIRAGQSLGSARTNHNGSLRLRAPKGSYLLKVTANGRPGLEQPLEITRGEAVAVPMEQPGYVDGHVTDHQGNPIPCKIEFKGTTGTPSPNFGPDTFEESVQNLVYAPHGFFHQDIAPGRYDVIISHGPEYDAVFTTIEVKQGEATPLTASLQHSVQTPGWVSSDFHSHSTPSGDNTSSQRGRVLNLLAEHLEFAPCTEHNRVSSYLPHLQELLALDYMATCSGMELTGTPLPVNHQNAFPIVQKPRTQDGGGPTTDENPIVQIERLALWDQRSSKVVQGNHPHIMQILGDKDLDGKPDGGFERMFASMDVIEVHPPETILQFPTSTPAPDDPGNTIYHWLRLLNQGYRIPGVVNTDAHYNFHGSGYVRNYLKSPTDEPRRILTADMVHAAERGQIIMTNGPYLEVVATSVVDGTERKAIPGEDLIIGEGLTLHVRVQCPNWLDVNRVMILLNGRPIEDFNFRRATHPEMFDTGVVKFDRKIPLQLEKDAHLIVVAAGEGLKVGPVVGPSHENDTPAAVSNPIYLDYNADGFQANGDILELPLPLPEKKQ